MLRTIGCLSLLCVFDISSCYESREGNNSSSKKFLPEGSSCQQLGLAGICRRVTDCPVALDALKRQRRHNLQRCGFVNTDEVVCCPDLSQRNPTIETTTLDKSVYWPQTNDKPNENNDKTTNNNKERLKTKRKCELMCEKIYKDNNIKPNIQYHVLNGEDANLGEFPHMAALGFLDDFDNIDWKRCGASLISSRFLLTAAHCVVCADCSDPVKVRVGVVDVREDQSAQDIDVKTVTAANYNSTSRHNDIALIELVSDVKMSKTIYPACLYAEANDPIGLRVTGWGQTEQGNAESRSDILQFAVIEAVPIDQCNTTLLSKNKFTTKIILNSQICAISKSDACAGDSGGPLQIQAKAGGYDIVGIVSYGIQCGNPANPGVYTRVSAYLDWIEDRVWPS